MNYLSRLLASAFLLAFIGSVASSAHAQEDEERDEEERAPAPREEPLKALAIEFNPLALTIGRLSANVEYLPAPHHALVVNPYYVSVNADVTVTDFEGERVTYEDNFSGGGAELGYRMYTGSRGPNGFFVGPSFLFGAYNSSDSDFTDTEGRSFTSYGFAVDIGGQGVIGPGIVVGGGFGLQYTKVSGDTPGLDLPLAAEILVGGGVRPRFLLSVGYAFEL